LRGVWDDINVENVVEEKEDKRKIECVIGIV
jgi:hypothetical protein